MPNMPRKEAHPEKYTDHKLLDYDEAQDYLGIRRSTLYSYVTDLDIETLKFKRNRKRYLKIEDVKLLERVIETPGLFEEILSKRQTKSASTEEAA